MHTVQLSILVMTRPALLDYIKANGIKATGIILFICSVCTVTVTPTKFLWEKWQSCSVPQRLQGIENFLSSLTEEMIGTQLARVYKFSTRSDKRSTSSQPPKSVQPCRVKWSNALRFDPTDTKGKCLHFTASLFVVSAAFPREPDSPSLVQISPGMISTYNVRLRDRTSIFYF